MDIFEFAPYHNYHIRFKLNNGSEMSGVIIDQINKPSETIYRYISSGNLIEWKKAEEQKDLNKMMTLEQPIDLTDIVLAERVF